MDSIIRLQLPPGRLAHDELHGRWRQCLEVSLLDSLTGFAGVNQPSWLKSEDHPMISNYDDHHNLKDRQSRSSNKVALNRRMLALLPDERLAGATIPLSS